MLVQREELQEMQRQRFREQLQQVGGLAWGHTACITHRCDCGAQPGTERLCGSTAFTM